MAMNFLIPIGLILLAIFLLPALGIGSLLGFMLAGFIVGAFYGKFLRIKGLVILYPILLFLLLISVGLDLMGFGGLLTFFQANSWLPVLLTGTAIGAVAGQFF